jgi:diadenosine tetraphosphate (Ap4A) HIT family hydrolase
MGQDHNHDDDCIFCKIAHGDIPAEKLYDDGEIFVIKDINPLTPVHLLIIPHVHTPTLLDLQDLNLVGRVFDVARKMAKEQGVDQQGFRILHNVNDWGGQKVFHIHFHLLAGTKLD